MMSRAVRSVTISGRQRATLITTTAITKAGGVPLSWSMENVREAPVVPGDVYRYYADPGTWGQWAHNTAWARAQAPVEPGTKVGVRVRSQPWTYTVRVVELEPGRRIVTEVRPFGVTITSSYEVTATADGSRIHHTISLARFQINSR